MNDEIQTHKSEDRTSVVCSFGLAPGESKTFHWTVDQDGLRFESALLQEAKLRLIEVRVGMYVIYCPWSWSECGGLFKGMSIGFCVDNPTSKTVESKAVITLRRTSP